jgi:Uma2 family endonuclease
MTTVATRRFSVEEYHRMAEAGILKPDDRVELLDGDIIPMAPMSSRHAAVVSKIGRWLSRKLADHALIRTQLPVRLDDYSEPEPDIALVRFRENDYADAHPAPADIFLLVEVAQSSLTFDREIKIPQYARAGVSEVWLFNLEHQHVECFSEPGPRGYAVTRIVRRGATLAPHAFPHASANLDDLLA